MPMLDSYLFFNGNCQAAMTFYQQVTGGQMISMMTYAQSPDPGMCAADGKDRIMHAHLMIDGRNLMASDAPPGQPVPAQGGFALSLNYPSTGEAKRAFDAFADGGKVTMPLSKTFWIETFGMVTDKFGTPWMVGGGEAAKG